VSRLSWDNLSRDNITKDTNRANDNNEEEEVDGEASIVLVTKDGYVTTTN
jgi:hypothetical protein